MSQLSLELDLIICCCKAGKRAGKTKSKKSCSPSQKEKEAATTGPLATTGDTKFCITSSAMPLSIDAMAVSVSCLLNALRKRCCLHASPT